MNTPDFWLNVLLECNRRDHSPDFKAGDQTGPTRSSRACAIALRAMADAWFRAGGKRPLGAGQKDFLDKLPKPPPSADAASALHGAGLTVLAALHPRLADFVQQQARLAGTKDAASVVYGSDIAHAHLKDRADDGSDDPASYVYLDSAGAHQPDPDNDQPSVHGAHWGNVSSFIGLSKPIELAPPPGYLVKSKTLDRSDPGYHAALIEVMRDGHAGIASTNPDHALIGNYWGYDGANLLGTPPRLILQILQIVADTHGLNEGQKMLLYGAAGTAIGEAGIHAWYNKFLYNFWRPVVGIRNHDRSFGTDAVADLPRPVAGNPFWLPMGAPRTNSTGKNFTPDFPAYPSGHATFGAAALHTAQLLLEKFFNKKPGEDFGFEFISDEFNGSNKDVRGTTRPRHVRKFKSLPQAYIENGVSRVFLGVHWRFDSHLDDKNGEPVIAKPGSAKFIGGLPLGVDIAGRVIKKL